MFLTTLNNHDGATVPYQGWPWGWNDSRSTNYAYTWMDGRVWGSSFGSAWFLVQTDLECFGDPSEADELDIPKVSVRGMPTFPDMRDRRKSRYGSWIPNPRVTQEG